MKSKFIPSLKTVKLELQEFHFFEFDAGFALPEQQVFISIVIPKWSIGRLCLQMDSTNKEAIVVDKIKVTLEAVELWITNYGPGRQYIRGQLFETGAPILYS